MQDQLIYQPKSEHVGDWEFAAENDWVQEISFESADGTRLVGWYGQSSRPARETILYFHGNAENIATQKNELVNFCQSLGMNLFMVDYRGFGKSDGAPTENGLLMDGLAAMQKLNEISKTNPEDVVVLGRSLGGAIAAHVATELGAKALVLHSTFASLDDLIADKFWYLPVKCLLWNRLRTIDRIGKYHGPVLIAHGADDRLIPIDNGERLFESCRSNVKSFVRQHRVGHHDCANRQFYVELNRFLLSIEQPSTADSVIPTDLSDNK